MKFIHRLGFYGGGFLIGLVILFFFLGGKKTSCDYGPDARVLKNIRIKKRVYSESTLQSLRSKDFDTSVISKILQTGNVLFSESNTDLDSCKVYKIEGEIEEIKLTIQVQNCDSIATIVNLTSVLD